MHPANAMYQGLIHDFIVGFFQVAKSNRIVVIGGAAVGVELVGELAPNKKVTLMHKREQILDERLSQKLIKKIQDGLKALKVKTFLGERVDLDDLDVGTVLTKDIFFNKPRLVDIIVTASIQGRTRFNSVY